METKIPFDGFIGPSYQSRSSVYDCQDTINMYLEIDETGLGKNGQKAIFIGTPGLRNITTLSDQPIRAVYSVSNQTRMFIIAGSTVYTTTDLLTFTQLSGSLLTSTGNIVVSDNGNQVVFVDGQYGYYIDLSTITSVVNIVDDNFYPSDFVTFQDGYFIFTQTGTNIFFLSDLYTVSFLPLNQTAKTGNSDLLTAAISVNRQLYLLGKDTLEIWYNAGQSGSSPFARQDGRFSQIGCISANSISILGEQFFWLGSNAQGGGIVYTLEGSLPKRVSTHAVEYSIQNTGTDLSTATSFAYQQEGHYFYCLNVPGLNYTWVYDMVTQQWAKRQTYANGIPNRWYAESHCVINDTHIVGDYQSGNVYILDLDYYMDNDLPKYYIRQTPHVSSNLARVFYKLLEIDFQFGIGNNDEPNPIVTLYTSSNGGKTWSNPLSVSLGKIGQWTTRARWHRLGYARDRVFKVVITGKTKIQMLQALLDIEVGSS